MFFAFDDAPLSLMTAGLMSHSFPDFQNGGGRRQAVALGRCGEEGLASRRSSGASGEGVILEVCVERLENAMNVLELV